MFGYLLGGISLWEVVIQMLFFGDIVYDGLLVEDVYYFNFDDYVVSFVCLCELLVCIVYGGYFVSFFGECLREMIVVWFRNYD